MPTVQLVHRPPSSLYWPAEHRLQLVAPTAELERPAGQAAQSPDPMSCA